MSSSSLLRVIIADDHAPTRAGVRAALEVDSCEVVAEVADARGAVEAAQQHRPDVCLLDISMPGNGIAAAADISRRVPEATVVMLTASRDDASLFDALRAGASGYLLKDMDPDRLAAALRGVVAGEAALPRSLVLRVVEEFRSRPKARFGRGASATLSRLTTRETEVLDLLSLGLSTDDVAQRLFVGKVTVRTHVAAILRKLQVPDRDAAIRLARGETDHSASSPRR